MKQNETDVKIMRESIKFILEKLIIFLVLFLFTSPISIHYKPSIAKADVSTQKIRYIHLGITSRSLFIFHVVFHF